MTYIRTSRDGDDDRIAEVVLDRPDKLNALSGPMLDELSATLDKLGRDPSVSCILLRGEGRSFSVGYDVGSGGPHETAYDDWESLNEKIDHWIRVWECPKPVISAIHGHCMGGATMLAVCTDITIVADDAVIGWPTIPLGGGLLSPVSMWLIGPKRSKELSYTAGSSMDGAEAASLGWANRAVPAGAVLPEARRVAAEIAKMPTELLTLKKRALNRVMDLQGFREMLRMGAEWDAIAHTSAQLEPITDKLAEVGLKGTVSWFRAGAR
ncbi:enoyl-CoA hydratase/isomerase family protein [Pseudonocardia sp. C8]|uniref:enoyl-CoA hydratase/isomerase family protein n=1 Tax=Pseudonocardia sp. C8 TaxID=2762759 RepID=UPI0016427C9D|nr:enoyl-CoA hydratase/isomerase family protein [Pseudonocardia sp. C8]MBC3191109.1 enoyl-CoA hydratase/isomerase family protein [Pseudonocardia sp. C8]